MEYPHVQQEIHLQGVHVPASYVSLPEGNFNAAACLWMFCLVNALQFFIRHES